MNKKVLYIISNVTNSTEYDLLVKHWDRSWCDLEFVLLNPVADCPVQRNIRAAGYACTTYLYSSSRKGPAMVRRLMRHLRTSRPDIVHANLFEATVFGLLAAWLTGIGRRVYTRHHSTHNHKYHPVKGVFYDRVCNLLAHRIVAITRSTEEVLVQWEKVPQRKVVLIYHGYEMDAPHRADAARLAVLQERYELRADGRGPVIGIISRPFEWKGLDHTIPALGELARDFPRMQALLFNWRASPQSDRYERMLAALPQGTARTVQFEPDVVELFHAFDVFVHVPEDQHAEAFGLVYAESLMAGVPCVFTRSGIMHDLDPSRLRGVIIVPFKDRRAIEQAVRQWLAHPPSVAERAANAEHNVVYLRGVIDIGLRIDGLRRLYASL